MSGDTRNPIIHRQRWSSRRCVEPHRHASDPSRKFQLKLILDGRSIRGGSRLAKVSPCFDWHGMLGVDGLPGPDGAVRTALVKTEDRSMCAQLQDVLTSMCRLIPLTFKYDSCFFLFVFYHVLCGCVPRTVMSCHVL